MVEHVNITDPYIHATKGIASAADKSVLTASSGAEAWVQGYETNTTRRTVSLTGSSTSNQIPASNGVAQNVLYGAAQSLTDISLTAGGVFTINTETYYNLKFNLNFGRTTGSGTGIIAVRLMINSVQFGFTQVAKLDSAGVTIPIQFDVERYFTAGTTFYTEIMRDAAGTTDGGLVAVTPTLSGWTVSPSAWVRVTKVQGTFS